VAAEGRPLAAGAHALFRRQDDVDQRAPRRMSPAPPGVVPRPAPGVLCSPFLAGIYTDERLRASWVFKGGTCLKKCYFETVPLPLACTDWRRWSDRLSQALVGAPDRRERGAQLDARTSGACRSRRRLGGARPVHAAGARLARAGAPAERRGLYPYAVRNSASLVTFTSGVCVCQNP